MWIGHCYEQIAKVLILSVPYLGNLNCQKLIFDQAQWHTPIILAQSRLKQGIASSKPPWATHSETLKYYPSIHSYTLIFKQSIAIE